MVTFKRSSKFATRSALHLPGPVPIRTVGTFLTDEKTVEENAVLLGLYGGQPAVFCSALSLGVDPPFQRCGPHLVAVAVRVGPRALGVPFRALGAHQGADGDQSQADHEKSTHGKVAKRFTLAQN